MTQIIPAHPSLGSTLHKKTESLLQVASVLKKASVEHSTNFICSGGTLLIGLSTILNANNPISFAAGTALTLTAGKRAYNVVQELKSPAAKNALGQLLSDVESGIGVLQIHGKINAATLAQLENTLASIENRSQLIKAQLEEVKLTSTRGKTDLEERQKAAFALFVKADDIYTSSKKAFCESQIKMARSSALFEGALEKFKQIDTLINSQQDSFQSRAERLEILTKSISDECEEARKLMDEANAGLAKGLESFDAATEAMSKAAFAYGQLKEGASEEFANLEALANDLIEKNNQTKNDLATAKSLVEDLSNCCEDSRKILAEIEAENKKAQEVHPGYSATALLAGGLVAGVTAGIGLIPAVAASTFVTHTFGKKEAVAKKVGDWALNIPQEVQSDQITVEPFGIAYAFDSASCGTLNRYIKKERSFTTGAIKIGLGTETLCFRFDFRNPNAIAKMDLFTLQSRFSQLLSKNPTSELASAFAKILTSLEEMEIDRGSHGKVKGILPKNSPYFGGIKRFCSRITSQVPQQEVPKPVQLVQPKQVIVEEPTAPEVKSLTTNQFTHLQSIGEKACEASKSALAIVLLLSKTAAVAHKHGTDIVTSGTTLTYGLYTLGSAVVTGGTVPAIAMAGVGAIAATKRIYDIIKDIRNPEADETLSDLLKNSEAGIAMLETVGESQFKILFQMDKTLNSVEKLSAQTAKTLQEIKNLSINGREELEKRQAVAMAKQEKAQATFKAARESFEQGKQMMDASSLHFNAAIDKFKEITTLTKNIQKASKEQIEYLVKISYEMEQECQKGKDLMDQAQAFVEKGTQLSDLATLGLTEAALEFGKLKERASEKFTNLEEKAKNLEEIHQASNIKVEEMQGHVNDMKGAFEDSKRLVADIHQDNLKAQKINKGYSTGAMIAGGIAAGLAAGAGLGLLPGIAATFLAASAYENKKSIARKVCDWAFQTPSIKEREAIAVKRYDIAFAFKQISPGFFNRYIRKEASQTVGDLDIDLGDEIVTFHIDLSKADPLTKTDQRTLVAQMHAKLAKDASLAPHFLAILEKIENQPALSKVKNSPILSHMKRHCETLLKHVDQEKKIPKAVSFLSHRFEESSNSFFSTKITKGHLTINLGLETVSYPFDISRPQKMENRDLKNLKERMLANLAQEPTLAPKYQSVLKELEIKEFTNRYDPYLSDIARAIRKS